MSSDLNTIFSFPGTGLDTDSDLVTIDNGDSRYRKNVIISDDGNFNVVTNTLGNTLKTHTLPSTGNGSNVVVGSVEDKENSAVIYFVHNYSTSPAGGHHSIIRYNSSTDTFTNILYDQDAILPDVLTQHVSAGIIGNEGDQFLIWTDGEEPKMINIQYAIDNNYSSTITSDEISYYKKPYTGAISAVYSYTSSVEQNNLKGKVFQFSTRYIYYDKTYTTISPYSTLPIPVSEGMPTGRLTDELKNNFIQVDLNMGASSNVISSIQLLYRVVDIGEGVPGNWYIYDTYDYGSANNQINFFNDKSIGVISAQEAARPYDFVPNASSRVGVIDSNRAVLDVKSEGFDNVDYNDSDEWDVSLTKTEDSSLFSDDGVEYVDSNTIGESGSGFNTAEVFNAITDLTSDDFYYSVICTETDLTGPTFDNKYFYIPSSFKFTSSNTIDDIISFINGTGHPVTADKSGSDLRITITPATPTTILVTVSVTIIGKTPTIRTLKTQARYKFGLRYGYGGKVGAVQTNNDLISDTYSFSDLTAVDTLYSVGFQLDINHLAPEGATDYQVVSFGSNIDYFEEYALAYNRADITDSASAFTLYQDSSNTVIKRDDMVNRFRSAYSAGSETIDGSSVNYGISYGFDIQDGDIVRFVGYSKEVDNVSDYDFTLFKEDLDFVISSVSSTEIRISSSALSRIGAIRGSASDTDIILIQILRLKETFDSIAQEMSEVFPIENRYHNGSELNGGGTTLQTATYPAIVDMIDRFSDVWKTKQVFINEKNSTDYGFSPVKFSFGWMEKLRVSLYYDSRPLSYGRFTAVNEQSKAGGDRKIYWSGKFIDDSGVNFISRVVDTDFKLLDDRNGIITVINQVGDTLKVLQERKVNSLYLKTTSSDDPNGSSTFVFSDNVMSDPRQGVHDYGCTHFSSYVKNVRDGYFFDLINADVLNDTPGGVVSISEGKYKMHTYFKEKSKSIIDFGKDLVEIHGTFDDDLDMYIISFVVPSDTSNSINDTVGFHEPSGRWFTHFSTPASNPIQYYGRLSGNTVVSFVNGRMYIHNTNSIRNNFWGEQFGSELWVHANESPNLNKIYDSIEINSVGSWSCPDEDSIEITKPSLMRSRLVSGKFKIQEGIFRSEFLRNALNSAGTFIRNLLVNGKILRGREMTVKLKNTDTSEAQVETISVRSTVSK